TPSPQAANRRRTGGLVLHVGPRAALMRPWTTFKFVVQGTVASKSAAQPDTFDWPRSQRPLVWLQRQTRPDVGANSTSSQRLPHPHATGRVDNDAGEVG